MYLDRISEAIAHFIGLFEIATEQTRMRDDYLEFKALQAAESPEQPDNHAPLNFKSLYDFDNPDPGIHYAPVGPVIEKLTSLTDLTYTPLAGPIGGDVHPVAYPGYLQHINPASHPGVPAFELKPPGSVAVHITQINNLSDSDVLNVGVGSAQFHSIGAPDLALETLLHDAGLSLPIPSASFASEADIGSFISDSASALDTFSAEIASASPGAATDALPMVDGVSSDMIVSLVDHPIADAIYVDGQIVADAPRLEDWLPQASPLVNEEAASAPETNANGGNHSIGGGGSIAIGETLLGQGSYTGDTAVDLATGGNALVNSATIVNDALAGAVFAAAGNYYSLDAIIQINAWSDSNGLGASLNGWGGAQQAATAAFNVADMSRIDAGSAGSADTGYGGFPKNWAVTEIKGDFVCLNWVQQYNFVIDNDRIVIASSHGVISEAGTGENQTFNNLSIADLGQYYDLVLIGGNYYDANIIAQTNVLLDDDVVGSIGGFHTSGHGAVSAGDNLLWNEAGITSVGHGGVGGLPDGFAKTLQDFAAGGHSLTSDVLNDDAFQGLAGLRVLYISGSIYDLQYIQQTNVLGDADQIALAMNAAHPDIDGSWSITTGSNALINSARIIDVDPGSKTYVGGDHYSDELLVQTDIIRTDHLLETQNADHLVNEAVVFLSDDMTSPGNDDPIANLKAPTDVHPGHSDVLQSVIS